MENPPDPIHRQKRRQVAKACDNCRLHRIKCDNNQPCTNCKTRSSLCSNSDETKAPKLRQACEEIALLKQRVQNLERELEEERGRTANLPPPLDWMLPHTPPNSSLSSPEASLQSRSNVPYDGEGEAKTKLNYWDGIQLRPARCSQASFFGPSSLYYFVNRLSTSVASSLRQVHPTDSMLLQSASSGKLLEGLSLSNQEDQGEHRISSAHSPPTLQPDDSGPSLTATQEEYFLNHFWQSYHTSLFAILDEAKFKKHHQCLWMSSSNSRRPSALVDIVLAMCMQYAVSALSYGQQEVLAESNNNDATISGRWYYRRCQALLTYELESPTISTLQCHLLCAIYLCGGSFHNMVDTSSGLAVRTAYQLGLHLEPSATLPPAEQEERRRLWWAVYVLDSKVSMKLGRPFLINDSYAMPRLPSDNFEASVLSGSTFATLGPNSTWLSFNLQNIKLYYAIRKGFSAFYDKDLGNLNGQIIWENPQAFEVLAEVLEPHSKYLDNWVADVPDGLKTKRQENGKPFSTDGSTLEIEKFAPLWLQRQRLLLELTYHHLCINLYRPFIILVTPSMAGSLAEQTAMKCASHAIAFTKLAQQVVSSTSILAGWYETFQWQFSATMTLAGFVYTYPHNPLTPTARSAIDLSVSVFDIFGSSLPVAVSAANIIRTLTPKLDFLERQTRDAVQQQPQSHRSTSVENRQLPTLLPKPNISPHSAPPIVASSTPSQINDEFWMTSIDPSTSTTAFDTGYPYDKNTYNYNNFDMTDSNLFDMAMEIEFWGDLHDLYPNADVSMQSWVI